MSWTLPSQPPSVGQQFHLSIVLPKEQDLESLLKPVRTTPHYWIDDISKQTIDAKQIQWTVSITYAHSGQQPLPPLGDGRPEAITIASLQQFVEEDADKIAKEAKPSPDVLSLPVPVIAITALSVLLLGLLTALAFFLIRRFSKKGRQEAFLKKNYSFKKVRERLETEIKSPSTTSEDVRQKAFVCSELLRGYSELCTKFRFMELTAEEIVKHNKKWRHLAGLNFPIDEYLLFLREIENTKYSNSQSSPELQPHLYSQTLHFLEKWHELEKR